MLSNMKLRRLWVLPALLLCLLLGVWFYFAPPPGGLLSRAAERRVSLERAPNTRELGGIPLRTGTFRKGMVYRSGALCFVTPSDSQALAALKIRTVLDFRTATEITRDGPDRPDLVTTSLPMRLRFLGAAGYASLPRDFSPQFRSVFSILSRSESYPVLYHCAVGKDRTGIVTALLLELLGADRPTIMDDYLQSARNSRRLFVRAGWLEGLFGAIDAPPGGIEAYLGSLGIDGGTRTAIRTLLIEPHAP